MNIKKIVLLGLLHWFIEFFGAGAIQVLSKLSDVAIEKVIFLNITFATVFCLCLYNRKEEKDISIKDSAILGFSWVAISIIIDFLLMIIFKQTTLMTTYITSTGIEYLIIPIITIGFTIIYKKQNEKRK